MQAPVIAVNHTQCAPYTFLPLVTLPHTPFRASFFTSGALHFRTQYGMGHRDGSGRVAISHFIRALGEGNPDEGRGHGTIMLTFGPSKVVGVKNLLVILSFQ